MFNRLSIFSFDTLKEAPKPTRSFVLCGLILIVAGSLLAVNRDTIEKAVPKYYSLTPVLSYLEHYCLDTPKVAFFGSSRFISCIKTDTFAELSGIAPSNVLNLSVGAGQFWEAKVIYRERRELFDNYPLIIIDVEPFMFNNNTIDPIYKKPIAYEPYITIWASLKERTELPGIATKASLVSDFFWPISERRSFPDWYAVFNALIAINQNIPAGLSIPTYQYNADEYQSLATAPNFFAFSIANNHMNNYEFSKYKADNLRYLVKQFEKHCDHIVLLQPPVRKEYMDVIYKNSGYLATYKQVLAFIHSLENNKVDSIIWETPADCGLDDSIFIDYGHFNLNGAKKFTEILYNKLHTMGLMDLIKTDTDADQYPAENIARLQEYLKYQPANISYRYAIGMLYGKNGQLDKAQREFQTALKLEPSSVEVLNASAIIYVNKRQYQEAISTFEKLIEIQPEKNIFYYYISCLYAIQNNKSESIDWLKKAIDNGYKNWEHLKNDKDLQNIKDTPYFKSLVENIQ